MILADTSIWIDHLRRGEPLLTVALSEGRAVVHPFVVGELACGNVRNRDEILRLLRALPTTYVATLEECLMLIELHTLMGRGIGFVDVHLLASARLSNVRLWTRDRRLAKAAHEMGAAFTDDPQGAV